MIEPDCSIELGGLLLLDQGDAVESVDGYTLSVMGEDTNYGNPQPVTTTVYSMLRDGSIITRDRDDNRQPVLLVEVAAGLNDGNALALGEKALMAVCRRPAELKWTPPQAGATPVVFDVVDSNIEFLFDEMDELQLRRTYRITMSALPHGRGEDEVVVEALEPPPVSPTTITFDTCDSATGWTTQTGAAATQSSGAVSSGLFNVPNNDQTLQLIRTGSVDFTPMKYLIVEWQAGAGQGFMIPGTFTLDGGAEKVSEQALGDGYTKTYFLMPGDRTALTFSVRTNALYPPYQHWFRIRDLKHSDAGPIVATGRQSFRSFNIGGTVTTQGSIDIVSADGTGWLLDTIVYTSHGNNGAQPHLSPWLTLPVSRTSDTATITGGWHATNVTTRWVIPKTALPDGEYLLVARLNDSSGGTRAITYTAVSRMGGVAIPGDSQSATVQVPLPTAGAWNHVVLGTLDLPFTPLGDDGDIQIELVGVATTVLDEAWLFDTAGRLTIVDDVNHPRLSIRAPSLEHETGGLWMGVSSDQSDWYGAIRNAIAVPAGGHDLEPGANNLFVVSTGPVINHVVTSKHYERVHTHPYVEA
jgi:hypothetical protein